MANLLHLAGWEVVKSEARILWPVRTPLWAGWCNRWLAPLLRHLCLTTFQIARGNAGCGVRNAESGPIDDCRLPNNEERTKDELLPIEDGCQPVEDQANIEYRTSNGRVGRAAGD
jgi:hypothetical protein